MTTVMAVAATADTETILEESSHNLNLIKGMLALAIFVMGLLSVIAPQRLVASEGAQHWFSLGNMAASGVLMSGGLVHMLADAGAVLNEVGSKFPMANFVAGLTFIGFMVLEELLHVVFMNMDEDGEGGLLSGVIMVSHDHGHGLHGVENKTNDHSHNHNDTSDHHSHIHNDNDHSHNHQHHNNDSSNHSHSHQNDNSHSHGHDQAHEKVPLLSGKENHTDVELSPPKHSKRRSCGGCMGHAGTYGLVVAPHPMLMPDNTEAAVMLDTSHRQQRRTSHIVSERPEHHHHHEDHLELHLHGSIVATCVLMLALSIHAILAGVSIGIESSPQEIASTALAILAHKSFEGFCLGSSLVSAQLVGVVFWSLAIGWTLATPIGIFVGQAIVWLTTEKNVDDPTDSDRTIAIVKAMVAGTFLYIAIVEIGSKELLACRHEDQQHGSKWQKWVDVGKLVCFVAGYLAMSALALVV